MTAPDTDEARLADRATMQHHVVADAHIAPERERNSRIGVQHGGVLNVDALAERDERSLSPADDQHGRVVSNKPFLAAKLDLPLSERID